MPITGSCCLLCRFPLSNRPYLKTFGLRSTVAWVIGSLADIQVCLLQTVVQYRYRQWLFLVVYQPGDVILDPMCGAGVLLIEAAREWRVSSLIHVIQGLIWVKSYVCHICGTRVVTSVICTSLHVADHLHYKHLTWHKSMSGWEARWLVCTDIVNGLLET